MFRLLLASKAGVVRDLPGWFAVGRSGNRLRPPRAGEMIKLPPGSRLTFLPRRFPLGLARRDAAPTVREEGEAVAALLPNGYLRTLLPAYRARPGAPELPIFGYAACALKGEEIWVAARRTDANPCWDRRTYEESDLPDLVAARLAAYPENRILQQLAVCALEHGCFTAQNTFQRRWEAAVPISPVCNAQCIGCLSKQERASPPSPQPRITFLPTLDEIVEVAVGHLESADLAILSFGQGCEGEPTMQGGLLEEAIRAIRRRTARGILNVNTNGSRPEVLKRLFQAGLDAVRVSMNSAIPEWFARYYKPVRYGLGELKASLQVARTLKKFASLNLLIMPGVTDSAEEMAALFPFLEDSRPDMVQLRNLNMDPDVYFERVIQAPVEGIGMAGWLARIKKAFPKVRLGNFTPDFRNGA